MDDIDLKITNLMKLAIIAFIYLVLAFHYGWDLSLLPR